MRSHPPASRWWDLLLLAPFGTVVVSLGGLEPAFAAGSAASVAWSGWLFAAILIGAFRAISHADVIAERLGEPLGTIVLTLAAITIEVAAVCSVMLQADPAEGATVVRDSMFAVLMLTLNGLIGLALVIGGIRRREQQFNLQSTSSYLSLITVLAMITLWLPRASSSEEGGWMSDPMEIFVGGASLLIYLVFLWLQTTYYREFFTAPTADAGSSRADVEPIAPAARRSLAVPVTLLIVSLLLVIALAKTLGGKISDTLDVLDLPPAIGGVLVAALVLAPEGLAALRAAGRDDMQRTVNVLLGSALATIGLTVPAVMVLRFLTGIEPEMGLEPPYLVLLIATLIVSTINLARGRVNFLQGMVHLILFLAWIMVILDEASGPPAVAP